MFVTPAFAQTEPEAAEQHTETGTAPEGGHSSVFPPFNPEYFPSQILWLTITFVLFYLFLSRVVLPRIAGILEVRRDRIAQDLDTAARMKDEADAAIAAYEQELADARVKANDLAQKARDQARADAEAERKSVEAGLEQKLADAEARISSIKSSAMKDVGAVAETTAAMIVDRLAGSAPTKTELSAAVKAAGA